MVKTFQAYLPDCHRTYSCIHCRAHLANHDELISKSFQGSQGRAYLFNSVVNVGCGPAEERILLTGLHAVADIYCECCKTTLGWKYEHAFESSQKYKEGKYIIEMAHMIKENGWESPPKKWTDAGVSSSLQIAFLIFVLPFALPFSVFLMKNKRNILFLFSPSYILLAFSYSTCGNVWQIHRRRRRRRYNWRREISILRAWVLNTFRRLLLLRCLLLYNVVN